VKVREPADEANLTRRGRRRERLARRVRRSLIETDHRRCIGRGVDRAIGIRAVTAATIRRVRVVITTSDRADEPEDPQDNSK
jgi:hypothetical protein